MHLAQILAGPSMSASFEYFPPRTESGWESLYSTIAECEALAPSFVSVTYGAGGTTRSHTHDLVVRLRRETTLDPVLAEDVIAWLREHPDFLLRNPEVLQQLTLPIPDHGDRIVDLQHFQLQKLRTDVDRLKDQQRELIATTRANLNNQNRVHAAVLFLLDATSFEQLIQTVTTDLAVLLDLDAVALLVEANDGADLPRVNRSGVRVAEPGTVARLLGKRDISLRAT